MAETLNRTGSNGDPIKHIIYLLLENHSFDQMLGCFKFIYPQLEGVTKSDETTRFNAASDGTKYFQIQTTELQMTPDPRHEAHNVREQLQNGNSGFVQNLLRNYPGASPEACQNVMGYYPLDFLPALHRLARDFTICDHWFSSLPGPTWPNRFFALTGTSSGRVEMPGSIVHNPGDIKKFFQQNQETIFDRLLEAHLSYGVYYYDFPSSLLLNRQRLPHHLLNYHPIDKFFEDMKNEAAFPAFSFVEPKYFGADENDDHPPGNIMRAEKLIGDVYNAIRSHDPLWQSSLLVITFDEHGGFYDHVAPPMGATPPDDHHEEYTFDQFGVRVPALLISPWVARAVIQTQFDHTSLLRYMIDKWGLRELTRRTAAAHSISEAIKPVQREEHDTVANIRVPYTQLVPKDPSLERQTSSTFQKGVEAFAHFLSAESDKPEAQLLETLAAGAGAFERLKNRIGNGLLRAGSALTRGLEERDERRVQLITKVINRNLAPAAPGPDTK